MGNQLLADSTVFSTNATNEIAERATLKIISGTWFVDDQKIVIENNLAVVFKRNGEQSWGYQESVEIKEESLHFEIKKFILSKGRLRANSRELMFRYGEDVRIWTREDPFILKKIEDFDVPICDEQGGDCLSLRHPSDMGANEREICIEEVGGDCLSLRHPDKMGANAYESPMTPSDSYEDGLPLPDDSAIDSEELPDTLPEVTPHSRIFKYFLSMHDFGDDPLHAADALPSVLRTNPCVFQSSVAYDSSNLFLDDLQFISDSSYISDVSSSDLLMHEPSWVDDGFFTEI